MVTGPVGRPGRLAVGRVAVVQHNQGVLIHKFYEVQIYFIDMFATI